MKKYSEPAFIAIPMAMVCSKSGCPVNTGGTLVNPSSISLPFVGKVADPLFVFPQDVSTRADEGFMYIYEPGTQLVFEINEIGGVIIRRCLATPSRLSELVSYTRELLTDVPDSVSDEIFGFLFKLKASGFNLTFA